MAQKRWQGEMGTQDRVSGPLVSVTVPVYNGQDTVAQAIHSLLAQTYQDLEIIVVDDGSTDRTPEVLRSFGSAIRAIHQANMGIAAARNTGLAAARGKFIALMDCDDECEPERIAAQVRFLLDHSNLVLCCSDFSAFNADGAVSTSYSQEYYHHCADDGVAKLYPLHGELDISDCMADKPAHSVVVPIHFGMVYEELALGNFVHPPTALFRRFLLDSVGMFDPGIRIMCEWDWLVRVARVGAIGFIDRPLLRYRLSDTQVSASEEAVTDSLRVASRICARDPVLLDHQPERFRRLFGELYADAADIRAERHPLEALSLLATSILRYHTVSRQTPRTLLKLLLPVSLIELFRSVVESLSFIV